MSEPNIKDLMKMAQEMQKSMKEAHDDLSQEEYMGEAGGGLVKVYMNGQHETKRVVIDPKVFHEDPETLPGLLADLFLSANNAVKRKIEAASQQKILAMTKKLGLPSSNEREE